MVVPPPGVPPEQVTDLAVETGDALNAADALATPCEPLVEAQEAALHVLLIDLLDCR